MKKRAFFKSAAMTMSILIAAIWVSPAFALDGTEILAKVDRNLSPESYEMYRKLINIDPDGTRKEFILYTVKKGRDRMVSLFLSPASEKGRATLRLDDNMWFYIPNVGKPIRITSLQSVVGGVFNNSDLLRLDYSAEYNVKSVSEEGGQYNLGLKAKTGYVAYDRLEMSVDKKSLTPVEIRCYASTGLLIKTLHYSGIKDFGSGVIRPAMLETDSPLQKGYRSVLLFSNIKARTLPDEVFTLNYLSRIDDLR